MAYELHDLDTSPQRRMWPRELCRVPLNSTFLQWKPQPLRESTYDPMADLINFILENDSSSSDEEEPEEIPFFRSSNPSHEFREVVPFTRKEHADIIATLLQKCKLYINPYPWVEFRKLYGQMVAYNQFLRCITPPRTETNPDTGAVAGVVTSEEREIIQDYYERYADMIVTDFHKTMVLVHSRMIISIFDEYPERQYLPLHLYFIDISTSGLRPDVYFLISPQWYAQCGRGRVKQY